MTHRAPTGPPADDAERKRLEAEARELEAKLKAEGKIKDNPDAK